AGWRRLGLERGRAPEDEPRLLPAVLQELVTNGRNDARRAVRQRGLHPQSVPRFGRAREEMRPVAHRTITATHARLALSRGIGHHLIERVHLELERGHLPGSSVSTHPLPGLICKRTSVLGGGFARPAGAGPSRNRQTAKAFLASLNPAANHWPSSEKAPPWA